MRSLSAADPDAYVSNVIAPLLLAPDLRKFIAPTLEDPPTLYPTIVEIEASDVLFPKSSNTE